jgi:hypothetical protein
VLAAAILATVTVAGLRAGGAAATTDAKAAEHATAAELAASLIAEVIERPDAASIGDTPDPLPARIPGKKTTYSTRDDFNAHSESPPADQNGLDLTAFAGWSRSVTVTAAPLDSPTGTSGSETGLQRITVTVSRNGRTVCRISRLLSDAP